jgi:hypothetical protein
VQLFSPVVHAYTRLNNYISFTMYLYIYIYLFLLDCELLSLSAVSSAQDIGLRVPGQAHLLHSAGPGRAVRTLPSHPSSRSNRQIFRGFLSRGAVPRHPLFPQESPADIHRSSLGTIGLSHYRRSGGGIRFARTCNASIVHLDH